MSLQLTVDVKKLYKQLCDKCKKKMIKLVTMQPTEDMIRRVLEGED